MERKHEGFIIYPTYRVEDGKPYVYLFGRLKSGKSFCTRNKFTPYFFIRTEDLKKAEKLEKFTSEETRTLNFKDEELVKVNVKSPKDVPGIRKHFEESGIKCYEADIRFAYRFMIDREIRSSIVIKGELRERKDIRADMFFDEPELSQGDWKPEDKDLKILSLDIESSMDAKKLYCVSMHTNDEKISKVIIVSEKRGLKHAETVKTEKELLEQFRNEILEYDPDIVTGWNLIDFDFKMLHDKMKQLGVPFDFGRTEDDCSLRISDSFITDSKADFPGRVVLDGIHMLKTSFIKLDDYKLGTAAKAFTDEKKLIGDENKGEEIEQAYDHDQQKLIDYNLLDSKLSLRIIEKSGALQLTILRSMLTGMPLDRVRASIASLDSLYLRELRNRGYAAPAAHYEESEERTTGGYVMDSKPGIYDYIIVCDFKSLYPSIMRTFNIDPLMFRPGCRKVKKDEELLKTPNGACFSKELGILPGILQHLWEQRDAAKKRKDKLATQAIKILMNSMYGVMASPNCRFYSLDMANAITHSGHKIIKTTADLIRKRGYDVIYGDTDSIFVHLNVNSVAEAEKIGKEIEQEVNGYYKKNIKEEYGMISYLELEFEKIFKRFFMPKVRGSEEGAKKRYAGLLVKDGKEEIDFTGLEFVRRDWTELSKKFQLELLDLIFKKKEVIDYIRNFVVDLKKGKYDDLLVYRKALRKDESEYVKTTPPHVKAARKLGKLTSNIIDYVMTSDGPEPIQKVTHPIDYEHYIDKQLKPIADAVLYFFKQDFDDIVKGSEQKSLFGY